MEPELAAWLAGLREPLVEWRDALNTGAAALVISSGRRLLTAMGAAGPGPVRFEDRVADLGASVARVVVAYWLIVECAPLAGDAVLDAQAAFTRALDWLSVPG